MNAIIMAGGEGSRLRPLTCACPKPMTPVLDRPVMQYALELLRRHGVTQVGATLMYLPDAVRDYFGDGGAFQVDMRYFVEETPRGTAGGILAARDMLDDTFFVLSGDGLTDCDLTAALAFHKQRGAIATMVLKKVASPVEYGVVVTESDGRVRRFAEKPGWSEAFSDTVNTGLYILEPEALRRIPEDRPYDFGRELFPALVRGGMPVYGWQTDGYWCDIGDIAAYMRAHVDMLDGRVKLGCCRDKPGGVYRAPGAAVDRGAILEGPCYIGEGARVEEGARIGAYTVLGAGSRVDRDAGLKRAVLWRGARAAEKAQLRGCVLQTGATAGAGAAMYEESALGDRAELGERAILLPGVRVWPEKCVPDGEKLDQNLIWGARPAQKAENGVIAPTSPAQAVKCAQAYCEAEKPRAVVMARDASAVAAAYHRAAMAGVMAQGAAVTDAGNATLPETRFLLRQWGMDGAIYAEDGHLRFLAANGAPLGRDAERRLAGAMAREDYARPFSGVTRMPTQATHAELGYAGMIAAETARVLPREGEMPRIALHAPNAHLLTLAEAVLEKAGFCVRAEWEEEMMELHDSETGVWLDETGENARFSDAMGLISPAEEQLLRAWTLLEGGCKRLVMPAASTRCATALAQRYGAEIIVARSGRAQWAEALLEEDTRQFDVWFDGLYCAAACIARLRAKDYSIARWRAGMPATCMRSVSVPLDVKKRGRALRLLAEASPGADISDGVRVEKDGAWAWIGGGGRDCTVVAEAADAEFAKELCDFYAAELKRLSQSAGTSS